MKTLSFNLKPQRLAIIFLFQDNGFGELICAPSETCCYVLDYIEEDLH